MISYIAILAAQDADNARPLLDGAKLLFDATKTMIPVITGFLVFFAGTLAKIWNPVSPPTASQRRLVVATIILGVGALGAWTGTMPFCIMSVTADVVDGNTTDARALSRPSMAGARQASPALSAGAIPDDMDGDESVAPTGAGASSRVGKRLDIQRFEAGQWCARVGHVLFFAAVTCALLVYYRNFAAGGAARSTNG